MEGGEALEHVAQRGGRCPIPANIQGQFGRRLWSSWRYPCSLQGGGGLDDL